MRRQLILVRFRRRAWRVICTAVDYRHFERFALPAFAQRARE
jgi:hypothetical protein